jgi:hypothetical protein
MGFRMSLLNKLALVPLNTMGLHVHQYPPPININFRPWAAKRRLDPMLLASCYIHL